MYRQLAEVEDRHFWFQARNRAIIAAFQQIRPRLGTGYRFLEVGCGTGNVLRGLQQVAKGGSLFGMDLELEGLRFARRRLDPAHLVVGDAGRPPFGVKFDVIGAFDVVEHIEDDVGVLRRLRDMLQPGGTLLLTVPANPRLWSYFDIAAQHKRRYRPADLRRKLGDAGFTVDYLTYFMAVLQPIVWGARGLTARRGRSRSLPPATLISSDLQVRPVMGRLLGLLLSPEVGLIAKRWRLPAGTSLLAVVSRA